MRDLASGSVGGRTWAARRRRTGADLFSASRQAIAGGSDKRARVAYPSPFPRTQFHLRTPCVHPANAYAWAPMRVCTPYVRAPLSIGAYVAYTPQPRFRRYATGGEEVKGAYGVPGIRRPGDEGSSPSGAATRWGA
jgi:hypothetical protein